MYINCKMQLQYTNLSCRSIEFLILKNVYFWSTNLRFSRFRSLDLHVKTFKRGNTPYEKNITSFRAHADYLVPSSFSLRVKS